MDEVKQDIKDIRDCQIRMEEDLKHHIKRTDILEDLHKDNEKRIVKLEQPMSVKQLIKIMSGTVMFVSTVVGLFFMLSKLL